MPNPFIRVGSQVQSKPVQDRPQPLVPVVEHPAGVNNPYRGIEDHGVRPNDEPSPPGAWADNHEGFTYVEIPDDVKPIPVEIVKHFAREYRRARILTGLADQNGQQIIGRNDARTSVRIENRDAANALYIAFRPIDNTSSSLLGFALDAQGGNITLTTEAAIYATTPTGITAQVKWQIMEEYVVNEA